MASSTKFPEYYDLLSVPRTATTDEIRTAYKKESLRSHPDRLKNPTPAERKAATERFQAVADAYYVLSDPTRRREYDILLSSRSSSTRSSDPAASANFFAEFAKFFSGAAAGAAAGSSSASGGGAGTSTQEKQQGPGVAPERPDADYVFADVFEELLRPEVQSRVPWWTWVGAVSGAGIGFIMANIPGALVGGYAGNRLGAIRDAKGKPVAIVFSQLGGSAKAEILKALAIKVLGSI